MFSDNMPKDWQPPKSSSSAKPLNKMLDKSALQRDLTDKFIQYQWRLENPMPTPNESFEKMAHHYMSDNFFHRKVQRLVSEVMIIVCGHID